MVAIRDDLLALYSESLSRTPDLMLRNSGRRIATEAATIPVPGSAVAHRVALTESSVGSINGMQSILINNHLTGDSAIMQMKSFKINKAKNARYASAICTGWLLTSKGQLES